MISDELKAIVEKFNEQGQTGSKSVRVELPR